MLGLTCLNPNDLLKKENNELAYLKQARYIRVDIFNKKFDETTHLLPGYHVYDQLK